jgi:SagB-type dehydrogenase family enzyme
MLQLLIKKIAVPLAASILLMFISGTLSDAGAQAVIGGKKVYKLPSPNTAGSVPLETTLHKRRSTRNFKDQQMSLENLAQLLWSAQGVTDKRGFRTAPSAGALYPLEIYAIVGNVEFLTGGIYHYSSNDQTLTLIEEGDYRETLCRASLRQDVIRHAPAVLIITGIGEKTTRKYGERGIRYMLMEAGHAAQNICLQAVALGLGSVTIGAFTDIDVAKILKVGNNENPLYIIPVGKAK